MHQRRARDACRGCSRPALLAAGGVALRQEQEHRSARGAHAISTPRSRSSSVWSASVGGGEPKLRLGLGVAVEGDRVFAASHDGDVAAFDDQHRQAPVAPRRQTTRELHAHRRSRRGRGPRRRRRQSTATSSRSMPRPATQNWKTRVNSEILSAPAIADGDDRRRARGGWPRLRPASAATARSIWSAEQQVPRLSLRGTARPVIAGDVVACGFDNGRVLGAESSRRHARSGKSPLHRRLAAPRCERLIDIDSAVHVAGDDIYAVTFQGRVARIGRDTGQVVVDARRVELPRPHGR